MSAFQIKCYLLPDNVSVSPSTINKADEIRRFVLAHRVSGLYDQLIEKIQSAYGSLLANRDEIKTYWQDDENDLVCFSTDSELQYALDLQTALRMSNPSNNSSSSSVFKIYITRKFQAQPQASAEQKATNEEPIHPGVVCDGCNGPIRGTRYNCTTCPDYDLCSKCKNKGVHAEHEFVVLTKPSRNKCPYSRNRGIFGNWHQRHRQQQQHQQQQQQPSTSNPIQETLNNFFPFLANNMPMVNNPEQLKNVGEYLKQFLDPFGIDVDYRVDSANNPSSEKRRET